MSNLCLNPEIFSNCVNRYKYDIAHVRYLLRKWGYTQKVPVGVHASRASAEEIHTFQKEIAGVIKKRQRRNSHCNTGRIHSDRRAYGTKMWLHQT